MFKLWFNEQIKRGTEFFCSNRYYSITYHCGTQTYANHSFSVWRVKKFTLVGSHATYNHAAYHYWPRFYHEKEKGPAIIFEPGACIPNATLCCANKTTVAFIRKHSYFFAIFNCILILFVWHWHHYIANAILQCKIVSKTLLTRLTASSSHVYQYSQLVRSPQAKNCFLIWSLLKYAYLYLHFIFTAVPNFIFIYVLLTGCMCIQMYFLQQTLNIQHVCIVKALGYGVIPFSLMENTQSYQFFAKRKNKGAKCAFIVAISFVKLTVHYWQLLNCMLVPTRVVLIGVWQPQQRYIYSRCIIVVLLQNLTLLQR